MITAEKAWNYLVAAPERLTWLVALVALLAGCRVELPTDSGGVAVDAAGDTTTASDTADADANSAADVATVDQLVVDVPADVVGDANVADADSTSLDAAPDDGAPVDAALDADTAVQLDATPTADAADATDTSDAGDASKSDSAADSDADTPPDVDAGAAGDTGAADKCVNVTCDDANPCTSDSCVDGTCSHIPVSKACDDGNACTVDDVCAAGKCTAGSTLTCDDSNPCTDDGCDKNTGCVYLPNKATCDDLNACTAVDLCDQSTCVGSKVTDCNDASPCTDDSCESSKGCVHLANKATCTDADKCNGDEVCAGGTCSAGKPLICQDGNACTSDACDPAKGCVALPSDATCDDANACTTGDQCKDSACAGTGKLPCDDANPCTDDACDPQSGCKFTANTAPCTDGNPCTVNDTCAASSCKSGPPKDCGDGNQCTVDKCAGGACSNTYDPAKACDDGNVCTVEGCEGFQCMANPAPALTPCGDSMLCQNISCKGGWLSSNAYSTTKNPNGPWTFGWAEYTSQSFPTMTSLHPYADTGIYLGMVFWLDKTIVGPDMVPSAFQNTSSQELAWLAPGQLSLHPGGIGGDPGKPVYSVLRWVVPAEGDYKIIAKFYNGDPNGDMVGLVSIDGKSTAANPVKTGTEPQMELNVHLAAGKTVEIAVGPSPTAGFKNGTTPVELQILAK